MEPTLTDLDRRIGDLDRRVGVLDRRWDEGIIIRKDYYDRDMKQIESDLSEVKDTLKWAMRLIAAQFLTLVVGLVVSISGRV